MRQSFASHAILLMIPLRFYDHSRFVLGRLLRRGRGGKSAINTECHGGYYDVLIDCLTTAVSKTNENKREVFEAEKDI
jgi:hypothetical protein